VTVNLDKSAPRESAPAAKEPVVCFGCYDYWNSNPGSPIQIMHAVHDRGHKVLWINSMGLNLPRLRKSGFLKRVFMRLKSWSRWLRPARPGFYVLAPIVLPLFGNPIVEKLNDRWLWFQIRLAYLIINFRNPLAIVCMPSFAGVVAQLPSKKMVYYYTDKYDSYRDIKAKEAIMSRDRQLFEDADLVLCASKSIMASVPADPKVHYFPHAVDFERFNQVLGMATEIPADMADIPEPRIGYFGSLTDSNDLEMIRFAAEKDPSLNFVLIGRVLGDFSLISSLPNVHLLGFKPHDEIPLYGKYFNIGIMNWKMTEWIKNCNPVKTKEYLSLGLPVISVAIDEIVQDYKGLVKIAEDGPQFLAAIQQILQDDTSADKTARFTRVQDESWPNRVEEMFSLLDRCDPCP